MRYCHTKKKKKNPLSSLFLGGGNTEARSCWSLSSSSRGLRSSRVICSTLQVVWVSLWYNLPAVGLGVSKYHLPNLVLGTATYSSKSIFSLLFLVPKLNLMLPFCECADPFPIPRLYNHPNGLPSSPINLSILYTQMLLQISCWYGILSLWKLLPQPGLTKVPSLLARECLLLYCPSVLAIKASFLLS